MSSTAASGNKRAKGKNIVLTGFMGTGKSTVGRILSERLGLPFIDTDDLVERESGMTVGEVFGRWGESRFRVLESRAVSDVARLHRCVVSVGGGALLRKANKRLVAKAGVTVLLTAAPEKITARTSGKGGRPLLPPDASAEYVERMVRERDESYSGLDIEVDTTSISPEEVARTVLERLRDAYPEWSSPVEFGESRRKVKVDLGSRSYEVLVAPNTLRAAGDLLRRSMSNRFGDGRSRLRAMILTNPLVGSLYGDKLAESLRASGFDVNIEYLKEGERFKSLRTVRGIYDRLLERGFDRSSLVVLLGGGVVGDTGGFAAATYMRGIPAAYVPTTLLAQVDASIGGKVGVNLPKGKNLIGCFAQPISVIADPGVLLSLPQQEFAEGMAEVAKYALMDSELFDFVEGNLERIMGRDMQVLTQLIGECARIKVGVVQRDETESGLRMVLNLGHTFAHAIENLHGYKRVTHGQAVAVGIHCACRLSNVLGRMSSPEVDRVVRLMDELGLPTRMTVPGGVGELLSRMAYDKKKRLGSVTFVIPRRIGVVELIRDVPREKLAGSIEACIS